MDNFYNAFFKSREFDSDFGDDNVDICNNDLKACNGVKNDGNGFKNDDNVSVYDECSEFRSDDDSIYEDVDTSRHWGMLDVIQEESDSDYYRSVDYCNAIFKRNREVNENSDGNINKLNNKNDDIDTIIANCKGYLEGKPKIYPKTISDKIYNLKKDFSAHDYVNVNFDAKINNDNDQNHYDNARIRNEKVNNHDGDINEPVYENINFDKQDSPNINLDRRIKNDLLRQNFFLSNIDKNDIYDQFNKYDKKIECQSIRNDVIHNGPSTKVAGSLNMKILNRDKYDKYNRVLTTTETFMESAEASFTKHELSKQRGDNFENFVKKSEKYFTNESRDRQTKVELNSNIDKGKTEIRIVYNPTFKVAGDQYIRGYCLHCKKRCPRTDRKCCGKCECLELEFQLIWKENWLNILLILALIFVFIAVSVQCVFFKDSCERSNGTEVGDTCFEVV